MVARRAKGLDHFGETRLIVAAVLGVSAYYHDSAAALVVDGVLVAAIQEERLSRMKNDASLPVRAMKACLDLGQVDAQALDAVVYYENPYQKLERILVTQVRGFPHGLRGFAGAMSAQLGSKIWVLDQIAEFLGVDRKRVTYVAHHQSHAASAFYCSPYQNASVLTVDGAGEWAGTALWRGQGTALELIESIEHPHSLGLLYAAITSFLGFKVNEGEYKVMGLAAFGEPRYRAEFEKLITLNRDGSFHLDERYFAHFLHPTRAFGARLEKLLGPARRYGAPWALETEADRRHADIAATLQTVLEEALLGLATRAYEACAVGEDKPINLCLAGGVALNAVANARLKKDSPFSSLYVHPAAGDAGGALGAALLGSLALGDTRGEPLLRADTGIELDIPRAQVLAANAGLQVTRSERPAEDVALALAQGKVVAFCQGRSEWGPRALGQRSLLAAPHPVSIKDKINRTIKHREPFRPFAPAVRADACGEYFGSTPDFMTPLMTTTAPVIGQNLEAITHRDGSARLQTVEAGPFFDVLNALGKELPPIALNTSLNGNGEPICASATDALSFFYDHAVDMLCIEDLIIARTKKS